MSYLLDISCRHPSLLPKSIIFEEHRVASNKQIKPNVTACHIEAKIYASQLKKILLVTSQVLLHLTFWDSKNPN